MGALPSNLVPKNGFALQQNGAQSRPHSALSNRNGSALKKTNRVAELRIILLGSSGAGKSTIFKQIRAAKLHGFNDNQRILYRHVIYFNLHEIFKEMIEGCSQLGIDTSSILPKYMKMTQSFVKVEKAVRGERNEVPNLANLIKDMWNSPAMQQCNQRRHHIRLMDCADHFLSRIEQIVTADYIPTMEDILRSYAITIGVDHFQFQFQPNLPAKLYDVGGISFERRKWQKALDQIASVIFVCDLSGYCKTVHEDGEELNNLKHSMSVFKQLVELELLRNAHFVVMFNKTDLFANDLSHLPLSKSLADYEGDNDVHSAQKYVKERFGAIYARRSTSLYAHFICAIEAQSVEKVVNDSINEAAKKLKSNTNVE